ncbi:MAG: hypothetical protein LBU26_05880 [Synergistaceae bacterium]|jgi:hypothetical protein|nr:hypothetical protein [Synergistaceae bacterium]
MSFFGKNFHYFAAVAGTLLIAYNVRQIFALNSARRRVTLPVRARVIEILEDEQWEWDTDMQGERRQVKTVHRTPVWEYEIDGKKYKSHAAGIVRSAEAGDEADLLCDPEHPSELWYPISGADYAFAARVIVFAIFFIAAAFLISGWHR